MRLPWSTHEENELRSLLENDKTVGEIAAALGKSYDAIKSKMRRWNIPGPRTGAKDLSTIESSPSKRKLSPEELCKQFNVDMELWTPISSKINKWEVGAKPDEHTPQEFIGKDGMVIAQLYQTSVSLKRNSIVAAQRLISEKLIDNIRTEALKATGGKPRKKRKIKQMKVAAEFGLMDAHLGMLAWGEETGENYDLSIAENIYLSHIDRLIALVSKFPVTRCILPLGNDFFDFDNLIGATTAGTRQDTDSRYAKVFTRGVDVATRAISQLAEIAPVEVVIVPGNHDQLAAFHLGAVMAATYAGSDRVSVDNSPKLRKYVRHGTCLIGFTHGRDEKHNTLPLIMAGEVPEDWAETTHREWHVGHYHRRKAMSFLAGEQVGDVMVRILPSLAATDAWHYQKGYGPTKARASEAYLWHAEHGYVGHFSVPVIASDE